MTRTTRTMPNSRTALRPLGTPTPLRVRADARGRPVALQQRNGRPQRVEAVRESWRIDDEWWRTPISRFYHEVVLERGATLVLYRDLIEERWYMHGGGG